MKQYQITYSDDAGGGTEIITSRFTKMELAAIEYAVTLAFEDETKEEEAPDPIEYRRFMQRLNAKLGIKGVSQKNYSDFIDRYMYKSY
jgi:hypothetical protein